MIACIFLLAILVPMTRDIIENAKISEELGDSNKVEYVITDKEEIQDVYSIESSKEITSEKSNSLLGRFFFSEEKSITKKNLKDLNLYYFVNTENGLLKKNLFETVQKDGENVFFKEIPESDKAFIEVKSAQFKNKAREKERKEKDIERNIYILNFPKEELELLKTIDFDKEEH
ncbi:hypothetical protein [Enterococcus sp. AZ103]|uniref:hypothetical protein n=1 Tax=Enterococcus sp. AZ103 TaxID=2774628 RepID=UPI003F230760